MKRLFFSLLLAIFPTLYIIADKIIWQIGEKDGSSAELALGPQITQSFWPMTSDTKIAIF